MTCQAHEASNKDGAVEHPEHCFEQRQRRMAGSDIGVRESCKSSFLCQRRWISDMGLYIAQTTDGSTTIIKVDGRLEGEGVEELNRVCRDLVPPFVLELTHLQQADTAGLQLINTLADAGVDLRGVSPYIALLLDRT